jgi:hypothetical protein
MESNIKQVVTMLSAPDKITLFTIEGEVLEIPESGPYQMAKIIEVLTPQLTGLGAVEIDLNKYLKLAGIVSPPEEFEQEGRVVVTIIDGQEVEGIFYPKKISATVRTSSGKDVEIPNLENLENHIVRATEEDSPSVRNFLRRLGEVIEKRQHSAEDLMQFIKMSEMPLTDDGRIIAYKRVNQRGESYVDVHSGTISQRIGSRVTMPVDMVDPSRHQSCSTGLHVANLGYLRGFSGSHTLVVLVDPANFIAVPHGETTKARVCSYDVIGVLKGTSHQTVCSGSHVDGDPTLEELIAKAVAGEIKPPHEEVFVGQKCVNKVVPLKAETKAEIPSTPARKANGTSLKVDSEKGKKAVQKLAHEREAAQYKDGMPPEVLKAFQMVRGGISKRKIGDELNTSDRSIGRWMEKWGYETWLKSNPLSETAPVEPVETKVDVYLVRKPNFDTINCIKLVRSLFGLDLRSAKNMVESSAPLKVSIPREYAEKIGERFIRETQSHVEIVPTGTQPTKLAQPELDQNDGVKAPAPHPNDANVGKPKTLKELARELYDAGRLNELRNFKKKRKKSWDALGFTTAEQDKILNG